MAKSNFFQKLLKNVSVIAWFIYHSPTGGIISLHFCQSWIYWRWTL